MAFFALLAIAALVIDGGMALAHRRQAQNAADAAALAAGVTYIKGGDYRLAALEQARQNGFETDGLLNDLQVYNPPISGPYAGQRHYLQVVLTARYRTLLASTVGIRHVTNTVEAISRVVPPSWGEMLDGFAVVSLAPHSNCQQHRAFWVHGEATLEVQGGGIWVNSDHPTCAFIQQGNGSIAIQDDSPFIIVGGALIQKPYLIKRQAPGLGYMQRAQGGSFPIRPIVGASPLPYPPPFVMPRPSCGTQIARVSEDGTTMSPGHWGENFPPPGVTKLKPGVYCIDGDITVEQDLEGTGVVLVIGGDTVRFSGSAKIDLAAPGGGPLAGLLMHAPLGHTARIILNGNAESRFRGAILAPTSLIRLAGSDSAYGYHSQIIGLRIEVTGMSNIVVKYKDEQNYDAMIYPSVEFIR